MGRPYNKRNRQPPLQTDELTVWVRRIPKGWGTAEVFDLLCGLGAPPTRISMNAVELGQASGAHVKFIPPPAQIQWVYKPAKVHLPNGQVQQIHFEVESPRRAYQHRSSNGRRQYRSTIAATGHELAFGVLQNANNMLMMRRVSSTAGGQPRLMIDLQRKLLIIEFCLVRGDREAKSKTLEDEYTFKIPFAQVSKVNKCAGSSGLFSLVIQLALPPMVYRKTSNAKATHDPESLFWDDRQIWYRQVEIPLDPTKRKNVIQLHSDAAYVDIGRCLTYRFVYQDREMTDQVQTICNALRDYSVPILGDNILAHDYPSQGIWSWLKGSQGSEQDGDPATTLSALHQMADMTVNLPFEILYQLEVCLSQGIFHESNLSHDFAVKLASINPTRASRLLEKAADARKRLQDPTDIFELERQVSLAQMRIPSYCTRIRSVTVTPTTLYINNPVVETSNRILRQYSQLADRFLRVKFRDETYKGRINSADDDTLDEIFTRIKQTMMQGIMVGGRHYEFFAFGNSQFREHGAYFFAATNDITAERIREQMGTFHKIKVIAKYASRLGQALSTTRATSNKVRIVEIQDIERNGFCFSDGVGKMSMFVAQMIAQDMGLPNSTSDCPSAYQFRLAGCKGVLVVDPQIKGPQVLVRPSQNKFPAQHSGLEICRVSRFSTVFLNQQILLILSSLGVPDEVFLVRQKSMLTELEASMYDEKAALRLLRKSVDLNQTTITLSSMIQDGFMQAQDPFLISCLRLWRSWSVKSLKEKSRILVDQGAFVLGCVDEMGLLRGHFDTTPSNARVQALKNPTDLPEIFLRITDFDPENPKSTGKYKVIEGICYVARNPSLHPGDIRMVRAVDVPELYHLRDCVVFPQTGDRDIPSMCSGGDLDGDDFLVVWDSEMLPQQWNHPPMDYTAPDPIVSDGPITVDSLTSFFVQHMRNDNLPRIANAHKFWADRLEESVKHPYCLELAALHSQAVDYAKTGVPAQFPKRFRPREWPHWAEKEHISKDKIYYSRKVIGKLYDQVKRIDFVPALDLPFNEHILKAYELSDDILSEAQELKQHYDEALRRLMVQHAIKSEFEVWTTFVMAHIDESKDWKLGEVLGETLLSLKQHYKELACERAGTNANNRGDDRIGPFVAAMYTVTAQEVDAAKSESLRTDMPVQNVPLMSFPWLFHRELGMIAKKNAPAKTDLVQQENDLSLLVGIGKQKPRTIDAKLFDIGTERVRSDSAGSDGTTSPSSFGLEDATNVAEISQRQGAYKPWGVHADLIDLVMGHAAEQDRTAALDLHKQFSVDDAAHSQSNQDGGTKRRGPVEKVIEEPDDVVHIETVLAETKGIESNDVEVEEAQDVAQELAVVDEHSESEEEEEMFLDLGGRSSGGQALDRLAALVGI